MSTEQERRALAAAPDWSGLARQVRDLRNRYRADPESKVGHEAWNLMADLMEEEGDAILVALEAMQPGAKVIYPGHVAAPTNADEAKAMWLIGERWIRDHAPETIRRPTDPGGETGAEAMREACADIVHRRGERSRRSIRDVCADLAGQIEALPIPDSGATGADAERGEP